MRTKYADKKEQIAFDKKVFITVWTLANQDSYREVANLFGIHRSTVSYVFHEICNLICSCGNDWIKWPNPEQTMLIKQVKKFPNAVGFIDGCHVQIRTSRNNPVEFFNRKEVHSILLQAVCDHKLQFTHVYIVRLDELMMLECLDQAHFANKFKI